MKTHFLLFLALVFCLAGCENPSNSTNNETDFSNPGKLTAYCKENPGRAIDLPTSVGTFKFTETYEGTNTFTATGTEISWELYLPDNNDKIPEDGTYSVNFEDTGMRIEITEDLVAELEEGDTLTFENSYLVFKDYEIPFEEWSSNDGGTTWNWNLLYTAVVSGVILVEE